jgi:nitroreductase
MEMADVLRRRRMVRSFSGQPVPGPLLDGILAHARRVPSAGNTDGWDGVVLEGPSQTEIFWEATTTDGWRSTSRRWPGLRRAPVVIALFANPAAYARRYSEPDKRGAGLGDLRAWPVPYWYVDAGFAALSILLACTDAGLGACFLGNFRGERELRRSLGVPGDRFYVGAVLLGHPGGEDPPSSAVRRRRDATEAFRRGTW